MDVDPRFATNSLVVFPGPQPASQSFSTLPENYTPTQAKGYKNHNLQIWIWARIEYCDVFGHHHWTQISAIRSNPDALNLGRFYSCKYGNETDDGKNEAETEQCPAPKVK